MKELFLKKVNERVVGTESTNRSVLLTGKRLTSGRQKKRLLFGTCATVFVAVASVLIFYGCKKDPLLKTSYQSPMAYSNPVFGQMRGYLCEGLINFKESLRPYYEQSQNYNDFCNLLNVNRQNMNPAGKGLLRIGYECLKNNYSDEYIQQYYTGKWLAEICIDENTIEYIEANNMGEYLFGVSNCDINNPLCDYTVLSCVLQNLRDAGFMEYCQQFCDEVCNTSWFYNGSNDFTSINISKIGQEGGMLVFKSLEHYAKVIDALVEICNQYSNHYIATLEARLGCPIDDADEDLVLEYVIEDNFFPFNPLEEFIELIGFTNSAYPMLREQEIQWLADDIRFETEENPFDAVGAGYVQSALHNNECLVVIDQIEDWNEEEGSRGPICGGILNFGLTIKGSLHFIHNWGTNPDKECSKRESNREIDKSFSYKNKNRKLKGVLVTGGAHVRAKTVNYVKVGVWWLWTNKVYVNFNGDKLTHCYDLSSTISASASNNSTTGLTEKYYWFNNGIAHINPTWLIPDGIAHITGNHFGNNYSTAIKTELIN